MLLLKEGAVEGVGEGVVEELEAVEDLDGATALDADDAAEDAAASAFREGGGGGGVLDLGPDAGVVIRDVDDHKRVELEGEPAARRRGRHDCA